MRFRSFISIILLLLVSVSAGRASATGTAVTGMVVDSSGGSLPGVTVTMTRKGAETAATEPLLQVTDGDGRFIESVPQLDGPLRIVGRRGSVVV